MKTAYLFAAISLVFSVSATATLQNDHRQGFGQGSNNERFGQGNRGSSGASESTLSAAGSASSATSTSLVDSASSVASTSTATEGASTATSTSTAAGGASNANSTSSAAGGASNANSTSTDAGATAGSNDAQSSLTLDNSVIATGFENNGQDVPTAGQIASLTSSNNFINFCLTQPGLPITNGKQITTGSCNPAPMGAIPSTANMPSAKFVFPANGDTSLFENVPFTIEMAIKNLGTGNFVNADENYFAAPQQLANGQIIGHSHVVVENLSAIDQTTPTDPTSFAFFKGLNDAAVNGILTANVTSGLPAGFYKLSSINTAANHQPVLVPIAQHGSLDDAVYFTVNSNSSAAAAAPVASSSVASAPAQPTQAKKGKRFYSRALN